MKNSRNVLILLVVFVAGGTAAFATVTPAPNDPALLNGITTADSFTEADAAYLQNSVQLLHDRLPEWYTYVTEAKPFMLSVDQAAGEHGVAAEAKCCDELGNGRIAFGDHLGKPTSSDEADDQTPESKQIEFLSTLIHEVTHVRDRRAGRIPETIYPTSCIASEKSAYGKELEFKRAAKSARITDDLVSEEIYRRILDKHINIEASASYGTLWKLHCLAYGWRAE